MAVAEVTRVRAGGRGLVSWWRLGAGAGVVGVPGALVWVCPVAAVVLGVLEVVVPLVVVVMAGSVAVFGSDRASGRVFRLLRLVAGRAEPPGPPDSVPGA
jgi:hypothetical protein